MFSEADEAALRRACLEEVEGRHRPTGDSGPSLAGSGILRPPLPPLPEILVITREGLTAFVAADWGSAASEALRGMREGRDVEGSAKGCDVGTSKS